MTTHSSPNKSDHEVNIFEPMPLMYNQKKKKTFGRQPDNVLNPSTHYLLALVDNLAVVLLESLVFFFCWVAEGFLSSCSSGSGAAGSRWSASELPLLVLGLSSSDLCLSLDILVNLFLGKLLKRKGGRKEMLSLRNKPIAFSSLNIHLKSYFNEKHFKVFTLITQQGYRGRWCVSQRQRSRIYRTQVRKPTHIFFHPLDNLSIVYFLRRHETDLPGNLGNEH